MNHGNACPEKMNGVNTIGVELLYVTAFAASTSTAASMFVAPVDEVQLNAPPVDTTPVPRMLLAVPTTDGGPAKIEVAELATTVARFEGTPGEWLTCATTDRHQSSN
jgi:hypothetical protein